MGFKVHKGVNAIAVSCTGSILKYKIGNAEKELWVPGIADYIDEPEPQCNHFTGNNIMAIVKGKEYSMVLRFDGTGCIFVNMTKILVKSFVFPFKYEDHSKVESGGTFFKTTLYNTPGIHMPMSIYTEDGGENFILTCDSPISLTFNKNENLRYMEERSRDYIMKVSFPPLRVINGELCRVDDKGKKIYALTGDLRESSGFMVL